MAFTNKYELTNLVKQYQEPVLVQSINRVGSKMLIASMMNVYDQVGRDIVAHSCNEVLCQGGRPLTFLNYVTTAKLDPDILEALGRGMAEECAQNGLSLVGGETAEMPGIYLGNEWDVAGTVLGVVEKSKIIDGAKIKVGDMLIGLGAEGLHTNGYSLARQVFFEQRRYTVREVIAELPSSVGTMLMKPHKNYTKYVLPLIEENLVSGLAHIAGGGLMANISRLLPAGGSAQIKKGSWEILPIFDAIQQLGAVPEDVMYNTMNMGIGMVLAVAPKNVARVTNLLKKYADLKTYQIGRIIKGERKICFV